MLSSQETKVNALINILLLYGIHYRSFEVSSHGELLTT